MAEDTRDTIIRLSGWALVNNQGEIMQGDGDSDSSESSIEVVKVESDEVVSYRQGKPQMKESEECSEDDNSKDEGISTAVVSESGQDSTTNGEDDHSVEAENSGIAAILSSSTVVPSCESLPGMEQSVDFRAVASGLTNPLVPLPTATKQSDLEDVKTNDVDPLLSEHEGACCVELLTERQGAHEEYTTEEAEARDLAGTNLLCSQQRDGNEAQNLTSSQDPSSKSDSDADSDFVQLDPDVLIGFDDNSRNEGALLRQFSVDDNFRFMVDQVRAADPPLAPIIGGDIGDHEYVAEDLDRDDETESFTEEGVDDRIESEQSETDSSNNDVEDLSAFADIGDIPLIAGNVPRNYIHRPNNHLSTVLNVTLALAAILTMGISLGIIMATDLEIEEWQNAYELQTLRVKQLESQLGHKKDLLQSNEAKLSQEESLNRQLRSSLAITRIQNLRLYKIESGLDWLDTIEDAQVADLANTLRGVVGVLEHCGREGSDLTLLGIFRTNESFAPCKDQIMSYVQGKLARSKRQDPSSKEVEDVKREHLRQETGNIGLNGPQNEKKGVNEFGETALNVSTPAREDSHLLLVPDEETPKLEESSITDQGKVELDVQHLQRSLSREQERALHWQSLYLLERRQRERDQENEEWEDERDRELLEKEWEKEREQLLKSSELDGIECLKKVLSSNLPTLKQHVALLNVSMIDDFANLSVLLSTVQDLKQNVVTSVQKVWKDAEELLERMQSNEEDSGYESGPSEGEEDSSIPNAAKVAQYLQWAKQAIQTNSRHQVEALLVILQDKLYWLKQGFNDLGQKVDTSSVADWLDNVGKVTSDVLVRIQRDASNSLPDKDIILSHIKGLLSKFKNVVIEDDVKHAEKSFFEEHKNGDRNSENINVYSRDEEYVDNDGFLDQDEEMVISRDDSDNQDNLAGDNEVEDIDDDDDDDDDDEEEEEESSGSEDVTKRPWSHGIKNILSRTQKSFQKIGKKFCRTLGEIKTIWSNKDQPLIRIAKYLTSKFVRASVKLTKMCTKLPARLFTGSTAGTEECQMLIHSKCVKKLRKQWQKKLLKDPCVVVGEVSQECFSNKKALKKDLKEVSNLFSQLLKIKTFEPGDAIKLSQEDAALHYELFKSFQDKWGGRHLLLKKDLEWAVCQRDWWLQVYGALSQQRVSPENLVVNRCDVLTSSTSSYPGGDIRDLTKSRIEGDEVNYGNTRDRQDTLSYEKSDEAEDDTDSSEEAEERGYSLKNEISSKGKRNSSDASEEASRIVDTDWYYNRAKYRLQTRMENERKSSGKSHGHYKHKNRHRGHRDYDSDDWYLKQAEDRKNQRYEHHKSDWLFERAKYRRHDASRWHDGKRKDGRDWHGGQDNVESWALRHGHHREKQRQSEHRADWVFDRAADRQEHHHKKLNCGKKQTRNGFHCAHGRMSYP